VARFWRIYIASSGQEGINFAREPRKGFLFPYWLSNSALASCF
jgi:hypothetical protein